MISISGYLFLFLLFVIEKIKTTIRLTSSPLNSMKPAILWVLEEERLLNYTNDRGRATRGGRTVRRRIRTSLFLREPNWLPA